MRGRNAEIVRFGPFEYRGGNGLWRGTAEVTLPPRALAVLGALVARPGEVVSKSELLDAGWKDAFVTDASLTEAVRVLRVALGDTSRESVYVRTVHRRGYRFVAAVSVVDAERPSSTREVADGESPGPIAMTGEWRPIGDDAESDGPWRPFVRAGIAAVTFTVASAIGAVITAAPLAPSTARLSIALPDDVRVDALQGGVAVAPDGSRIAFVADAHGGPHLFVREVREFEAREVRGSAGARDPFFSPDGRRVGFFAGGRLSTVGVDGDDLRVVAPVAAGAGATWLRDDTIVFGGAHGGGLARVSARGGAASSIVAPAAGSADVRFGWPERLPAGDGLLFTVVTPAGADLAVTDASPAAYHVVARDAQFGRFAAPGVLVTERDGRLLAGRVTHDGRALTSPLAPAVGDVATSGVLGGPRFAVSASGALVYVPGAASGPQGLRWLRNPVGTSPEALADALVLDRDGGNDARLTSIGDGQDGRAIAVPAAWRPDGLEVAFALNKSGPFNLFVQPSLGGTATPLGESPWNQAPTSWSPDGHTLVFTEYHPQTGADVWTLDLATRQRRPLVRTSADETGARFSPDGRWIAYLSNGRGPWEVVVQSTSGGAPGARLSAAGLVPARLGPAWQGRELRVVLAWGRELQRTGGRTLPRT